MKKLILFLFVIVLAISVQGQGLFKPVPKSIFEVKQKDMNGLAYYTVAPVPGKWILRLNTGVMGVSYELKKGAQPVPFSAVLFGVGYFYYKNVNGEPFNVWGVNGGFLTNTQNVGIGTGLFGVYNTNAIGLLNAGVHYDWSVDAWFIDTGISYKF
jgi:hypothetical protein